MPLSKLVVFWSALLLVQPGIVCGVPAQTSFRQALPGYQYQFPRDHGSHPEFATEWWYYTGHLRAGNGRRFGYQMTWFRTALTP
ncbi:carotenoid 1,2-hydratase, partial [bacterium]